MKIVRPGEFSRDNRAGSDHGGKVLTNIVLIGFMGCGKSSVGRRLASLTGFRFVDTDEQIVAQEKRSIADIFASEGEAYFRSLETRVLEDLCGAFAVIVATGGGAVLQPQNRPVLREIGSVVWLDAEPDILFERAMRSGRRPLLYGENPRENFDRLLHARLAIYKETAHIRVDCSSLTHEGVASSILAAL